MADVTDATFERDVIERSKQVPVVVDLWAPWCGPCKTLGPIIEKVIADTGGQVELAKVNVDENPQVSQAFQVQSIPAVYALKDGKVVDGFVGAQPEAVVRKFVDTLLPTEEETEVQRLVRAGDAESLRRALDLEPDNPDAVGLGDLGRKEGYIERQLKRWYKQVKGSQELTKRELPDVDHVHDILASQVPEQGPAAIVHGDYRLDNCMIGHDGRVAAVLEWELCTLGDPMADVGLLMVYWNDPDDASQALVTASATTVEGFPRRAELLARYAERSGRDLSKVDYYVAFGYWKLACILEGVYARYQAGVMGSAEPAAIEGFRSNVERLASSARAAAERVS